MSAGTTSDGQAVGSGCVYPASVRTLPDQLAAHHFTWKGYMEDIGNSSTEPKACRHPAINTRDDTQQARAGDQYAARHDPFVYFHSIIDGPACAHRVVGLDQLSTDLRAERTTPNLAYITPNLCNDGHDAPCVDGRAGGPRRRGRVVAAVDPAHPVVAAFRHNGLLVVTFDESDLDGGSADAASCCGEGPGPNAPLPGIMGLGGGRVGAVVVSRWTRPARVNAAAYNHYGLLRSIEDLFGLGHLGYARDAVWGPSGGTCSTPPERACGCNEATRAATARTRQGARASSSSSRTTPPGLALVGSGWGVHVVSPRDPEG